LSLWVEVRFNATPLIEKLDGMTEKTEMAILEGLNETLTYSHRTATGLAQTEMPSKGGSYLKSFLELPARKVSPSNFLAVLKNTHQWAEAVERGGGPIFPSPEKRYFRIPDGKSFYMVKRRFRSRRVPRGFYIFRRTARVAERALPRFVTTRLMEAWKL